MRGPPEPERRPRPLAFAALIAALAAFIGLLFNMTGPERASCDSGLCGGGLTQLDGLIGGLKAGVVAFPIAWLFLVGVRALDRRRTAKSAKSGEALSK